MRSRSSSPNTPSSDSSPSSSDLPLAAPPIQSGPQKELDDERLFSAFIDPSVVYDTTSSGLSVQPSSLQYERLSGVLSSVGGYHVPPPTHVVRPPALAPSPDDELEEPEPEQEVKPDTNVVHPPKESCVNLPIRVRNVPLQGAKSRVETQLKVTIDLVWDPTRPAHFHHGSSSLSGHSSESRETTGESTVGSWEWLALPSGSATKRRGRKEAKIECTMATPDDPLRTSHHILFVLAFFVWLELRLGLGLGLLYGALRGFDLIVGGHVSWGWMSGVVGWGVVRRSASVGWKMGVYKLVGLSQVPKLEWDLASFGDVHAG
ncbi:hypothetical protein BDV93DRAFT_512298 [Ceratobasidium sp. AG-I]|nr:hypothetical protein BDV93DRAFT_512298 [Ceratobasidium sp. AG-I]